MRDSKAIVFHIFEYSNSKSLKDKLGRLIEELCQVGYLQLTGNKTYIENIDTAGKFFTIPLEKGKLNLRVIKGHACIGVLDLPYPYREWQDQDNQDAISKLKPLFDKMLSEDVVDNYIVNRCVYSFSAQLYLFLSVGRSKWFLRDFNLEYSFEEIRSFYHDVCLRLPGDEKVYSIDRKSFFAEKIFLHNMDKLGKKTIGKSRKNYSFKK